eukprot:scaffold65025_cov45-Prasinocladus_malaysianus.AAC.1
MPRGCQAGGTEAAAALSHNSIAAASGIAPSKPKAQTYKASSCPYRRVCPSGLQESLLASPPVIP